MKTTLFVSTLTLAATLILPLGAGTIHAGETAADHEQLTTASDRQAADARVNSALQKRMAERFQHAPDRHLRVAVNAYQALISRSLTLAQGYDEEATRYALLAQEHRSVPQMAQK